jgi:hypothetical protein
MTAVNLLKANWISIQEIFELVSRVLTRMFVGLWPKQKAEVPNNDLKKLAQAFDTTDDPVLQLKGLSLKRGAEGAIALSYAHGADFDWEKVNSPHGRTRTELKAFEKAKKLAPAIVSIISPSAASADLLRQLPRLQRWLIPRLLQLLAMILPCLPLPWSRMLRWHRLGFFVVVFNFCF